MKKIISIIPARSGSKGLRDKNILDFSGHPLMAWSINYSLKSELIDRTIVSTDSEEYMKIAKEYGAETPFIRPKEISQDKSTDFEFLYHALTYLKEQENYIPDLIVLLRPTCPLRTESVLKEAVDLINASKSSHSLKTVVKSNVTPYKMWYRELNEDNFLSPLPLPKINQNVEDFNSPRQSLPDFLVSGATIDIIKYDTIVNLKSASGSNIVPLEIPREEYLDIDTIEDFENGQALLSKISNKFVTI